MLRHVLLLFIKSNASVLSFAVPKYYHMKELGMLSTDTQQQW